MKRNLISLFVMFLASITLSAQSGMTYSWEFVAGVGVGKGPQVSITPEFVAQYDFGGGFRIGAGAGTRFARPCLQYFTEFGSHSRSFCNELDIPVFLRLGYGKEKLYAHLDAGYAICALTFYDWGWASDGWGEGRKEPSYDGFFIEPQAFSLSRRSVGKWVDGVLSLWVFFYSRAPYPTMSKNMWIPQRFHTGIKSQH